MYRKNIILVPPDYISLIYFLSVYLFSRVLCYARLDVKTHKGIVKTSTACDCVENERKFARSNKKNEREWNIIL